MKASFASRLEEEIPRNMTPTALEADNVEQAGRTPHFRRLEAEQNIQMLKKSLQMSGMKINSALYDSPMTVASADSENIHPNRNVKGNLLRFCFLLSFPLYVNFHLIIS